MQFSKGKKILYCNYQGLKKDADILPVMEQQMKEMAESTGPILLLVNVTDSPMTADSAQCAKENLAANNTKIKKVALVGVTGIKTIIAQGIGKSTRNVPQEYFGTIEEAKNWLVS